MTLFGRKARATAEPIATTGPAAPLPLGMPVATGNAGGCDRCADFRSAASFGRNRGPVDAQMLMYCLSCGASWLVSSPLDMPTWSPQSDDMSVSGDAAHARARRTAMAGRDTVGQEPARRGERIAV